MKNEHFQNLLAAMFACAAAAITMLACAADLSPTEARAISREAYTYGFPLVEGYKTLHKQALDRSGSDYKAPLNELGHSRNVAVLELAVNWEAEKLCGVEALGPFDEF